MPGGTGPSFRASRQATCVPRTPAFRKRYNTASPFVTCNAVADRAIQHALASSSRKSWGGFLTDAGVAGFEPTHGGVKVRCLTAWLHPSARVRQGRLSLA